jgi:Fe2+ or Zn2+ uptake regulation protein
LGDCRIESMLNGYEEELGLKVKTHTLYVTGICASCMRSGNTD